MTESPIHDRLNAVAGGRSYRHLGELTGTNAETVRRYMQGQPPSADFLVALCSALGVNAQWLLTGHGPMLQADVKGHVLKAANATDLLTAMADTIERLIDRVQRLERFVQALDVRMVAAEGSVRSTGEGFSHGQGQNREGIVEIKGSIADQRANHVAGAIQPRDDGRRGDDGRA